MLILELTISLGATISLLIMRDNPLILWICTAFFGLGMSAIFPTIMALSDNYVVLTGRYAAAMVFGGALGEMLIPLVIGFTTRKNSPTSFPIGIMTIMILLSIAVGAFMLSGTKAGDEYEESDEEEDQVSRKQKGVVEL
jgi:fucose permease